MTLAAERFFLCGETRRGGSFTAEGDAEFIRKQLGIAWRKRAVCRITDQAGHSVAEIWQDIDGDFGRRNQWVWFSVSELSIEDLI